jgi:hypothetical protein
MPDHPGSQFGHGHPRFVSPLIAVLDSDTNGIISAEEMAAASTTLKTLDKNGDGQLTPDEFLPQHLPGVPQNGEHHRFAHPIVTALDTNGDGTISAEEIANAPAALKTLDRNGDGQLNLWELFPKPPGGLASHEGERPGLDR